MDFNREENRDKLTELVLKHKKVALAGAGGKTTTLLYLGKSMASAEKSVLCFTTTHMERLEDYPCPEGMVLDTRSENTDAVKTHSDREFDFYIYEADGSRGLPLKTPNEMEPVLLDGTDLLLVVMGMSAIGKTLEKGCHRYELLLEKDWAKMLRLTKDSVITPQLAALILAQGYGRFATEKTKLCFLLNQADGKRETEEAEAIEKELKRLKKDADCIILCYPEEFRNVRENF